MKKLTRMKLINWHYIVDSTIDFNGSCLLTGDNGSGKSTILDAMQFVLTCGKARFNSAAHEKAKRDLLGYVRCKTGNDSSIYLRSGDISSHVALEFYEEKKRKYFIIGAAIDSSSDLSAPKSLFYRIENKRIDDELFLNKNMPRNISEFKIKLKSWEGKSLLTQSGAQEDFVHRFGSIGHRFFELLPKALAFRPISNVKDFVYSYLLDEKQVNIEYLKENVRTYMEFEKVLDGIKLKISRLDDIVDKHGEVERINENIKIHDYIILKSQKDIDEKELKNRTLELEKVELLLKNGRLKENEIERDINSNKKTLTSMQESLMGDQSYKIINSLQDEIEDLTLELKELKTAEKEFEREIQRIFERLKKLHDSGCEVEGAEEFKSLSKCLHDEESVKKFISILGIMEEDFRAKRNRYFTEKATFEIKIKDLEKELEKVEKEIKTLENRQLVYDENIIKLKTSINDEIKLQTGKDIEPRIICELLQIKDPVWKDAVEGYLNTQRFNLIVDPEYFDISIDVYERVKKKKQIHSVGLINTGKLEQYSNCPEDSLAYIVSSNNKYAKYYANMILGKVVRCDDVSDLKKFHCSITPTCMVYQNNTARQINPAVYNKPYIGEDAYKRQLELKTQERDGLKDELSKANDGLDAVDKIIGLVDYNRFEFVKNSSSIKLRAADADKKLMDRKDRLSRIDKSTILSLQLEIENVRKIIIELEKEGKELNKKNARLEVDVENINKDIEGADYKLQLSADRLCKFEEENMGILSKIKERYEDSLRNRDLETVFNNFVRNRTNLDTQKSNRLTELIRLQMGYNNEFHFGGAEGADGMEDFYREYKTLKESKVIEYEDKIKSAREKAEEEFKEHFLAKLQENIVSAQNEFKKLNDALKGINFGGDEYKFQYSASKEYQNFYEMIMDEGNMAGFNLFTGVYREKHKEAMDELFERITIDDENSKRALEKFTDYRTFMDYDIKIFHENGNTSSFSRVCREKSGGETQTPYYVAIAASFVQLYHSGLNGDSIGLILFDEAFDKMDENRIESMMQFLNKRELGLQVLLAAPPQKIESIAQHVGTTLVVFKEDDFSFVEALYQDEKLQ